MGTYLSTPVTEKSEEAGESTSDQTLVPVAWGVVDMQGWRKSMEDAHVAQTDIPVPQHHFHSDDPAVGPPNIDAKVFGVFDGHGGPEVARFCQLYLVSVLTQQPTWKEEESPAVTSTTTDVESGENGGPNMSKPSGTDMAVALRGAFHALDRMIDDPSRREELSRLKTLKLEKGERREAQRIPPPSDLQSSSNSASEDETAAATASDGSSESSSEPKKEDHVVVGDEESDPVGSGSSSDSGTESVENAEDKKVEGCELPNKNTVGEVKVEDLAENDESAEESKDDDSNAVVGVAEAAAEDQNLMDAIEDEEQDDENDLNQQDGSGSTASRAGAEEEELHTAGKVSVMFQRLLNISAQNMASPSPNQGQIIVRLSDGKTLVDGANMNNANPGLVEGTASSPAIGPPSKLQNGRMICNLPDHPIHAGATAIVAVLVGKLLTVANAGDSRGVLCRGGTAVPLSFDHKPQQESELRRIQKAGGFVNQFGRVNGNLNLSRSIGDLKYKQVPGIPPAEQMITAEPDILQATIQDNDEFMILGCDGIWDCLSNQQAVDYVRSRIATKGPIEIGREMLDDIISTDPRTTQGIGGDNMTVMIVDLQPHSRTYRKFDAPVLSNASAL